MRALRGAIPRRFKDHRCADARRYTAAWRAIAGRFPGAHDDLGRRLIAVAADTLLEYERLAQLAQRPRVASARRKYAGLLLGVLRTLAGAEPPEPQPRNLDEALAAHQRDIARGAARG